jgi:hypothetical protein
MIIANLSKISKRFFSSAYRDFKHLKERGYPPTASLKLVGDRYGLPREQRNCLFRGVVESTVARQRLKKIVSPVDVHGAALGLDWFNILITLESYLKGVRVFLSDDGMVRDCAAVHGSWRMTASTDRAVEEILAVLAALAPARIDVTLDSPIAHSGLMAEELRRRLQQSGMAHTVRLERSADYPLKSYEGIGATPDSAILDRASRVLDLPRRILEERFAFSPPLLSSLFAPSPG